LQTLREGTITADQVWKRFRSDRRIPKLQDEFRRLANRARRQSDGDWRWVLRDVDFEVEPGSSVGLIGANGSGKSTLLKILTRVMYPSAGQVLASGRVGALIEVRAGIHGDLTGRENIFLTGSLMGLSRREVARRFDEILAFSELEDAVDRQVKYYSTGMQMRLGFSVAAFLEPDVLLVDEVLAVGDASFQQRCLDRMRYVLSQGTTLVFVSHDLAAVEATCTRGLWLNDGIVRADGPVREVVGLYRRSTDDVAARETPLPGAIRVTDVSVQAEDGLIRTNELLDIELSFESDRPYLGWLYVGISEGTASPIFVLSRHVSWQAGETHVGCSLPRLPLPRGEYSVWTTAHIGSSYDGQELLPWQPVARFDVYGPELDGAPRAIVRLAPLHVDAEWRVGVHDRV
jgi:ABC-type polysaccharide/polyol phosphate transport system ATPase subunit